MQFDVNCIHIMLIRKHINAEIVTKKDGGSLTFVLNLIKRPSAAPGTAHIIPAQKNEFSVN